MIRHSPTPLRCRMADAASLVRRALAPLLWPGFMVIARGFRKYEPGTIFLRRPPVTVRRRFERIDGFYDYLVEPMSTEEAAVLDVLKS